MRHIIATISSLVEYLAIVNTQPEKLRPSHCLHCGKLGLWCHGHYTRKADKENSSVDSLNPIPIFRFYCPNCRLTCSSLPECIPPNRHYLWDVQQKVILLWLLCESYQKTSDALMPSRWTISRWCRRLVSRFSLHASALRNQVIELGRFSTITDFWCAVLHRFTLSRAMLLLNNAGINIP